MRFERFLAAAFVAVALSASGARAQGVTTGAVVGTVTNDKGAAIDGAQVLISNRSTGVNRGTLSREDGRFIVQGLDVGMYSVTVRRIGFAQQVRDGLLVTLGQATRADFTLSAQAAQLATLEVRATSTTQVISQNKTGVGTTITDTAIARFPSLNRDFTDFARAAPQVSTTGNGLSGGGVNNRYNNIQIDGASESDLFGLGSNGRPGDQAGAKSISLEAVKEYQVLLSPFDVRQGNFAGVLINAVTKSGTNNLHGSGFYYTRNQNQTRKQEFLGPYSRKQYGFSLGGPIVKNRAFFFLAPEWQTENLQANGPFIGSADSPVSQTQVDGVNAALLKYGVNGGSGDALQRPNPLTNIFGRVDINLSGSTRAVIRHNYGWGRQDVFSRDAITSNQPNFGLSSNLYGFTSKKNSTVGQLFTNFSNGAYNELNVGYTTINDFRTFSEQTPQITVTVPRQSGTGTANFVAGTEASSQGNALNQKTIEITDNFTFPLGDHNITLGTKNIIYESSNLFASNRFGTWRFSSIDSLNKGIAASYAVSVPVPVGTDGFVRMKQATYAAYVQDAWNLRRGITLQYGVRVDVPTFNAKPLYNSSVDSAYKRNTSELPTGNIQWSPRVGINWDITGDQRNQLRAGAGYFTGSPAYVWISNAFSNTGLLGTPGLTCNNTTVSNANYPPAFTPSAAQTPPTACGGTNVKPATAALSATVNTLDPNLKFPQFLKLSAGYDHDFGNGLIGTVEGLFSKAKHAMFYSNLALTGPQGIDARGRTMYGTITGNGSAPVVFGGRNQVYDASNSAGDYSWNLTAGLQKRFSNHWEGAASYTRSKARDIQSTLNSTANSNFNQGRTVSGDLLDKTGFAPSKWEQPHKFVLAGTYTFQKLDVSVIWSGQSGAPYDYTYRTDENADGSTANDLLYVPSNAADANEILFTGYNVAASAASVAAQQQAFETFVGSVACLRDQRGKLMTRMSCRAPFTQLINVALRQSLPKIAGQNISAQLDIFNFANLVNNKWGNQPVVVQPGLPAVGILSRTAVATQNGKTVGVYTFDTGTRFQDVRNAASNYRMQLSLRFSF